MHGQVQKFHVVDPALMHEFDLSVAPMVIENEEAWCTFDRFWVDSLRLRQENLPMQVAYVRSQPFEELHRCQP